MFAFVIIGIIAMALGSITGFGVFLYNWGGEGMDIGVAAWDAFKFWMKWMAGGLISIIVGAVSSR